MGSSFYLEVTPGFEPGNEGFADPCLTTWLCHRVSEGHYTIRRVSLSSMNFAIRNQTYPRKEQNGPPERVRPTLPYHAGKRSARESFKSRPFSPIFSIMPANGAQISTFCRIDSAVGRV